LRADTFRNKSTHTVANSFADKAEAKLDSALVSRALKGETGVESGVSYDGLKSLSYYAPLKIRNLTWAIVTELDEAEVYADLRKLTYYMVAIIVIGIACIALVAYFFGTNIASRLRSFAGTLRETSNQLSEASGKGAATATSLSESTTEQASSIQETMASAEEISAMVNQNAESSSKALSAVDSNLKASDNGSRSVDEMLVAIREIKDANTQILEQMDASNKEFAEIVRIITEIGEKTNVINEIVFQTKLLSFNASVEAARAGEHGKGFAVVAEEVGNLAQMSGNAAKEITDMLSDSIKRVNGIVEKTKDRIDHLVEVGKDKIATGQSTAQKCREALNSVNENAKSIATMISEIANASKEQAQGIQEINKAIAQMDQVTQINSATANQSSSQATQLSTDAATLGHTVTELMHFVEGQSRPASLSISEDSATAGKVLPLLKKTKVTAKQAHPAQPLKATGTSPVAPSSNNPGFEEF
jgi:methyl-accepting chemotaxis protein